MGLGSVGVKIRVGESCGWVWNKSWGWVVIMISLELELGLGLEFWLTRVVVGKSWGLNWN